MEKFTVELLVENKYGVLNRITALYAKRGYNIDSLYVHATEDASLSRMLITSTGDDYIRIQMVKQISKLYDVRQVILMTEVKIKI
ncbi:MAG: acetolactate synthase small subunit [Oscillospiraceae bacterium]|nr:acetolactate synthase small subunit [Oscillospiraceae bacterium]